MPRFIKNIIGQKIGRLTVISKDEERSSIIRGHKKRKLLYFVCQCDCGNKISVRKSSLLKNKRNTNSCGCLQKEKAAEIGKKSKFPLGEAPFNNCYLSYKNKAKKKKLPFLLSKLEFKEISQQKCYYCGQPPSNAHKTYNCKELDIFVYNGIDRIDSQQGYEKANCRPCCIKCNVAKLGYSETEFYDHLIKIINYRILKELNINNLEKLTNYETSHQKQRIELSGTSNSIAPAQSPPEC